ncbi:Hypothetical predicted protein [Pelobates cultripes]|uniref:Uncharacterized protein n=1 Tax=Pelobates cultripes TaxID=61616 RepID=A0AAD1RTK9_PELCU|nr:Hypothetical predicted protein [Pelobates cultripes]
MGSTSYNITTTYAKNNPANKLQTPLNCTTHVEDAKEIATKPDKGECEAADHPARNSLETDPKAAEEHPRASLSPPPLPVRDIPAPTAYRLFAPKTVRPKDHRLQYGGCHIAERKLHTASTILTTPASIPPETSSPTSGRRTVTTGGSTKRRRRRNRRNKLQQRASSQPHIHLRFKRPRLRTGAEATPPICKPLSPNAGCMASTCTYVLDTTGDGDSQGLQCEPRGDRMKVTVTIVRHIAGLPRICLLTHKLLSDC